VLVDLPGEIALSFPKLLHMPSTLLLVSDGSIASIREVARWRDFIGPNTPERRLLHVLNKKNVVGALPQEEMLRVIPPPDIAIDWDRQIIAAAALGTKTVQQCGAIRDGMAALSLRLSGVGDEPARSLWKRVFG
jgi:pilus assembly protein CpaE